MKVMIGHFMTESNEHVPEQNEITSYDIAFHDDVIDKMQVRDIFEGYGVEMIPSIYASAGASGVIKSHAFTYILECFKRTAKKHLHELDGIYLMLHGASKVEGLANVSGDHQIVEELRKIVGPYMPIVVACDPHGNLKKEYVENITYLRSYRESPHIDSLETYRRCATELCEILQNRVYIHSIYRKLPLILGGEQSVSFDEPVYSINQYMNEIERDHRIRSCSWHVGYLRHDSPYAGCGIVVVPNSEDDFKYANEIADKLYTYIWDKREEFHYTGLSLPSDEAFQQACNQANGPVVITDSGDNTTSGASGANTYILRQALDQKDIKKKILFASICDKRAYKELRNHSVGDTLNISIGANFDELSKEVPVSVTIKAQGEIVRMLDTTSNKIAKVSGACSLVQIEGTQIDIIVANDRQSYTRLVQFEKAGTSFFDYDIVVVKQGYIFPEIKEHATWNVMSLTDGPTLQDTRRLPFHLIMRPMFPIDKI